MNTSLAAFISMVTLIAPLAHSSALTVRKVATGGDHACALMQDRSIKCWGGNSHGQLGLGDDDDRGDEPGEMGNALLAVDIDSANSTTQIALGTDHSCAVYGKGILKCWGANDRGQLGLGHTQDRGDDAGEMGASLPAINVDPGHFVERITAGTAHTCAILDDGHVKCWGANDAGQLGLGDDSDRGNGMFEMGNFLPHVDLGQGRIATQITAGYEHTCALLDDGEVKCWGGNSRGQLGAGHAFNRGDHAFEMGNYLSAVDLGTGRTAVHIEAGNFHTCALLDDDTIKCWGENQHGELGTEDSFIRGTSATHMGDYLQAVSLGLAQEPPSRIMAGGFHSCALLGASLRCWGHNITGQLGIGDRDDRGDDAGEMGLALSAADLGTSRTPIQVDGGWIFSCARFANDRVKCWGANFYGQLGLGDQETRGEEPAEMGDALPFIDLGISPP